MGRSKAENENALLVCVIASVLALQSLSTPAYCSRRILEGLPDEEMNNYVPSTPTSGSPTKHSSTKSCPTPSGHSTPTKPSHGSGEVHHNNPPSSTPAITVPSPPVTSVPSPPLDYDHNVPPFHPGTCSYWNGHPDKITAVIGFFSTIGDLFGPGCVLAYGGKNLSLNEALASKNTDSFSALLREGTAALLNSMACKTFPFDKQQVKNSFLAALSSDGAAAAQAALFKSANEGLYTKPK